MKMLRYLSVAILFFCNICWASEEFSAEEQAHYEAAIRSASTEPLYVQVTITDNNSNLSKNICTTANFLLGAIHKEYELGYDKLGSERVLEIALANESHHFVFSKQAALDNVQPYYTPDDLVVVRARLKNFSIEELKKGLGSRGNGNLIDVMFQEPLILKHFSLHRIPVATFRQAFACVLVEKGIQVRHGHGVRLYIDEE